MANKDDYLTDYRCFFENFAQTVNPNDQLPVKLGSYKLVNVEVVGGIIDWTTQYLTQKQCPQSLLGPLIKIIIDETRKLCKKQPVACGFNPADNAYEPLKLMQTVMAKTNEICLRYLDNSKLCSLPTPGPPYNAVSVCAVKNIRRRMEDRHVVIHDLNSLFIEQEVSPSSYYAIFDGHAGHDAAAYSCAHLHQFLAESKDFVSNPEQALRDAFLKTDALFLDKCKVENFSSGTTAVCALLRHKEKTLYIAWVGDSQALLVSPGRVLQCVQPHKPCRQDEKNRIEQEGGCVIYWGTWRVNGQLAVSRAIGDYEYKPYVTAVPDVVEIPLTGNEDFLILACDGLWDFISEEEAARCVYDFISKNPDDIDSISQRLVQLAKQQSSCDNISVIVVFLRETSKVAAEAHWATRNNLIMDTLDNANTTSNPFVVNSNNPDILAQKEGFVLNLADGFKQQNGTEKSPTSDLDFLSRPTNGKRSADEFDDDDEDLGPETDVDAVDDVLLSPAITAAKNLAEGIINNNPANIFDPFCEKEEKATLETDSELQKQQTSEFDSALKSPREETPTPPADSVLDASGLVDNVADSGEDSDDEWNYFKGDTAAQKENIPPSQTDKEVCELTETEDFDSDNMSQLNPNAAEFVPISPKRNTASPTYQALIDDNVIAQSPRRITNNDINVDINVPNPQEFECEIKSRPSDVRECANGDDLDELDQKLSSQELMENLLNGKSIDEIEFQPNSTPTKLPKPDEFHFGPNATPFSTPAKLLDQSEALSTKAVFGDESTASYLDGKGFDSSFASSDVFESQVCGKEQEDPMSMSFYQEKDEDTNPFDLNKVQVLPENIDDFLEKPAENNSLLNDTISDLPEHNPMENIVHSSEADSVKSSEITKEVAESHEANNDNAFDALGVAPLNASKSPIPDSQSPLPLAESPLPESRSPLPESRSPLSESRSPLPELQSPVLGSRSPVPESQSPLPISQSPLPVSQSPRPTSQSPLPTFQSPIPPSQSPLPTAPSPLPISQSPLPTSPSPVPPSQSPLPISEIALEDTKSPVPTIQSLVLELASSPIQESHSPVPSMQCELPKRDTHSPLPLAESPLAASPSPLPIASSLIPTAEERTQSPLFQSQSPLPVSQSLLPESYDFLEESRSPLLQSQSPIPQSQSPFPQLQSPLPQSQSPLPQSQSPLPQSQSPLPQSQSPLPQSQSPIPQSQSPIPPQSPILQSECLIPESHSPLPAAQSPLPASQSPILFKQSPFLSQSPVPSHSPLPELESPVEDITSSVKDSPVLATSPIETESKHIDEFKLEDVVKSTDQLVCPINYAQQLSDAVVETIASEIVSPTDTKAAEDLIPDSCLISTPKSVTSEHVDTESIVTADVNSFLERSSVPDIASPMSINSEAAHEQEVNNLLDAFTSKLETNKVEYLIEERNNLMSNAQLAEQGSGSLSCASPLYQTNELITKNIDFDIKSEIIAPEYPVQIITTPSEESKTEDLTQNEVTKVEDAKEKVVEAIVATTAVAATAAAVTATAAAVQKKTTATKPKPGVAAPKKLAATKPATSPTKSAPAKTTTKLAPRTTTTTTTQRTTQVSKASTAPKTTTTSAPKASPKPKTPTNAIPKSSEKKPLTNGDVKPAVGATLTFKKVPSSATSKTTATTTTRTVPNKLSPTKIESRTSAGTARPATAPTKTTTLRQSTTTTSRPTSLATKTSTTSTVKSSTLSSVTANKSTTKSATTTATSPKTATSGSTLKARPTTAPARAKPPMSRPAPKAADTEKQIKETANKQLTAASRTSTTTRTTTGTIGGKTSTTTVRKTETRAPMSRTSLTKTTTTTKIDAKKPTELIRHTTATKTNKITGMVTKKTKTEQNGIVTEINTITVSATNGEPQLVKDVSPVIENVVLDNFKMSETNVTD